MSRLVLVLLLLTLASVGLPTAGAQSGTTVDLTLPNLPAPVQPGTTQTFNATVRYSWSAGVASGPTTVHLEVVDQPPWLTTVFDPPEVPFDTTGRPTGVNTTIVSLTVGVAADAPAFEQGLATYRVTADPNPTFDGSQRDVEFPVTAGFSGDVAVTLPDGAEVDAAGGFLKRVPVRIENLGNGPLVVDVRVARFPAEARVEAPDAIALGTTPDTRVVVAYLDVRVPWKVSESGPVEIEVLPVHATRGTPGAAREASFQLEGHSAIPVPSSGPLALLVTLGAGTLLRRRH